MKIQTMNSIHSKTRIKRSIVILLSIFLITGCSFGAGATQTSSVAEDKSKTDVKEELKIGDDIEQRLNNALSPDMAGYIATATQGINALVWNGKLSVNVRVTVVPDAMPMIADKLCPVIIESAKEYGIDEYEATFMYYSEGNDGERTDEEIWRTHDCINGIFVTKETMEKMTIEELYKHYNNFGNE